MRSSTTSTQIFGWLKHLDERWEKREKIDHWLALLRHDIHCLIAATCQSDPETDIEEFYPKFQKAGESVSEEVLAQNRNMRMTASQYQWFKTVGLDMNEVEQWTAAGKPPESKPKVPVGAAKRAKTLRD